MSRFNYNNADNYGAQKNSYFSLKDDGDTAVVRFLYNNIDDIEGVATHEIEVDGKKVDVECLRAYNEPVDNCPLCAAGYKVNAKMFIPLYDETSKEVKIWTRGKTFFSQLAGFCSHYNPLVSMPFEVQRIGKKGDTSTRYQFYPRQMDNSRIEDFEEIKAEGLAFQSKSYDDLVEFLRTGRFIDNTRQNESEQRRETPMQRRETPMQRRETPATPIRRRPTYSNEDTF